MERDSFTCGECTRVLIHKSASWLPGPISQLQAGLRPPGKPSPGSCGGYDPTSGRTGSESGNLTGGSPAQMIAARSSPD